MDKEQGKAQELGVQLNTEVEPPATSGFGMIHKKMVAIMGRMKKLRKGRKANQGYMYWGIEDLVPQFREALIAEGVYLIQDSMGKIIREERKSAADKPLIFCVVQMRYTLYAEDGSWVRGGANGEAQDNIDKAEPKAETGAYKNFLKRLLQVETESESTDPDHGGQPIGSHGTGQPQGQRQPQQAGQPKQKEAPIPEDCKPIYSGIMVLLGDSEPYQGKKVALFSSEERIVRKRMADETKYDLARITDAYKVLKMETDSRRSNARTTGQPMGAPAPVQSGGVSLPAGEMA
ncbi:MAG: ERF family protein [Chloroflexi bacterium]|nr:ERF family protein [Chloroflexota bacterium]